MTTKIISIEKVNVSDDVTITVRYTPGWFLRLFGFVAYTVAYRGRQAVWHEYPSKTLPSVATEIWLHSVWNEWRRSRGL